MTDYNFSFESEGHDSQPIAIISEGDHKSNLIYLNKADDDIHNVISDKIEQFHSFAKRQKRLRQDDYDTLLNCIEMNKTPDDKKLQKIYQEFKSSLKRNNEVLLSNSKLQVVPKVGYNDSNKKSRETILVNGANDSGKSYWVGEYMKKWRKLFPRSEIFLLSNKPLSDEPAFAGIKNIIQIPLTKKRLEDIVGDAEETDDEEDEEGYAPYQYFVSKNTSQSLVVCDDFESDGIVEKLVRRIQNSILQVGRAKRIYCIIVSHMLNKGYATKTIFSEIDYFCFFPKGMSPMSIDYCLKKYTRMKPTDINRVIDSDSKWVFICRRVPSYVIEQNRLWLY